MQAGLLPTLPERSTIYKSQTTSWFLIPACFTPQLTLANADAAHVPPPAAAAAWQMGQVAFCASQVSRHALQATRAPIIMCNSNIQMPSSAAPGDLQAASSRRHAGSTIKVAVLRPCKQDPEPRTCGTGGRRAAYAASRRARSRPGRCSSAGRRPASGLRRCRPPSLSEWPRSPPWTRLHVKGEIVMQLLVARQAAGWRCP